MASTASVSTQPLPSEVLAGGSAEAPLRVLVVEDDAFTLTILRKRLQTGGHEVFTAADGLEGWRLFQEHRPDLVLSDWMMPEMDGHELCRRIKGACGGDPVYFILLTAKDKNDDKVAALDSGADEYLVKPCDGAELMARIRAAGRIQRLQCELSRANSELKRAMKRINTELRATSDIQRSLLPSELPPTPGYRFAAHYQPSTECSGDFYDLLPMGDGRLAFMIGDVSGHGTPAMVTMVLIHTLLMMVWQRSPQPAALLSNVNRQMCRYLPTGQFVTLFYGLFDPATGLLTYSSAGHNPPLLVNRRTGQCEYLTNCEGFPIKLIGTEVEYENHAIQLGPDHGLILYTDGLLEAMDPAGNFYGPERLAGLAARQCAVDPDQMKRAILDDLDAFIQGMQMQDDLSLLIMAADMRSGGIGPNGSEGPFKALSTGMNDDDQT